MSEYRRVFMKDHQLLAEMLSRRLGGLPYQDLTREYGADKTSIRNWCRKFNIEPKTTTSVRIVVVRPLPNPPSKQYKYQRIFDENDTCVQGKSHKRYIVEARMNYIKSLYAHLS